MKKLSIWHFEPTGDDPAVKAPLPGALGYTPAEFVAERRGETFESYFVRVREKAGQLPEGARLIINCEHFPDNLVAAIRLAAGAKDANPKIKVGLYTTPANGDRWGLCAKINDPAENKNAKEVAILHRNLKALDPFVDFWCVDLYDAETSEDQPTRFYDRGNEATARLDTDATWEAVSNARVLMLTPFGKPWIGFFGPNVVAGVAKRRSTILDKNVLYARAAWCKARGADSICVMVFDPSRRSTENTGNVKPTADITQALTAIGGL